MTHPITPLTIERLRYSLRYDEIMGGGKESYWGEIEDIIQWLDTDALFQHDSNIDRLLQDQTAI